MDKVFLLSVIGVVLVNIIKQIKPEYAPPLSIALSLTLVGIIALECKTVINIIGNELVDIPHADKMYRDLIKILLIGYVSKFICNLCDDYGMKSLSDKVDFASRLVVISVAISWIKNLLVDIKLLL